MKRRCACECARRWRAKALTVSVNGRNSLCRPRGFRARSCCSGSRAASWRFSRTMGRSSQVSATVLSTTASSSASSRYSMVGRHSVCSIWSRLRVVLATAMVISRAPPASYMARRVTTARIGRPCKAVSYHWARSGPRSASGWGSGKSALPASTCPSVPITLRKTWSCAGDTNRLSAAGGTLARTSLSSQISRSDSTLAEASRSWSCT